MRSVLTSRIDEVIVIGGGSAVVSLTNGLSWRAEADDPIDSPEGGATLYHDGLRFFLEAEGWAEPVEVQLVACRRKVWEEAARALASRA